MEQYSTIAFEYVTDSWCCILRVSPVQVGAHNDKHIVCLDPTVAIIRDDWYCKIEWYYYN